MCFNASLVQTAEIIEDLYGVSFPREKFDTPFFFVSAFEHPLWPILPQGTAESFQTALWGLIPRWTKNADTAASLRDRTLNARFESLSEKPSFRGCVDSRRCGVLIDGFVEWRLFNGKKYPYHLSLPDGRPFLLAGLWDSWKDPESDTLIDTFTVVTVEARGVAAQVHNTKLRMPLILGRESGSSWLDGQTPFSRCQVKPFYKTLTAHPVSREVSVPGKEKNVPGILSEVEYPELPPLEAG